MMGNDDCAVRPVALHLLDFPKVGLQRPVGDELDIVETDDPVVVVVERAVARGDVDDGRIFPQRFPHHPAPTGLERSHDVIFLVRGRRGGKPERIG
jgi:hypothetical protein